MGDCRMVHRDHPLPSPLLVSSLMLHARSFPLTCPPSSQVSHNPSPPSLLPQLPLPHDLPPLRTLFSSSPGGWDSLHSPAPSNHSLSHSGAVCHVAFVDRLTLGRLRRLEAVRQAPDKSYRRGLWRVVLVSRLPYNGTTKAARVGAGSRAQGAREVRAALL